MLPRLSPTSIQFIKYLLVGGSNFLFGVGAFYLFLHVAGLNYLIAFSITWLVGVFLTYIVNYIWIFKPQEKLNFKVRLFKYFLVYFISYLVNVLLLKELTEYTHLDPFFVQLGIIPIVMVINFLGMKFWSLK